MKRTLRAVKLRQPESLRRAVTSRCRDSIQDNALEVPFSGALRLTSNMEASPPPTHYEASFWVRRKRLRIGRLEPDTAAKAIRIPLEDRARSVEQEALRQVVAESHGYPFLLRLWGGPLRTECNDPSASSSLVDIHRVRHLFQQGREDLYEELLDDLRDAWLVSVATAGAAEFSPVQQVPRERVTMVMEASPR